MKKKKRKVGKENFSLRKHGECLTTWELRSGVYFHLARGTTDRPDTHSQAEKKRVKTGIRE